MTDLFDVAVCGDGIVGRAAALAMARKGLSVTLLGHGTPGTDGPARMYTISEKSTRWLDSLGVGDSCRAPKACEVSRMRVFSADGVELRFTARNARMPRLCAVIREDLLAADIDRAIREETDIDRRDGATFTACVPCDGGEEVHIEGGDTLRAKLVVVADGRGGKLARSAGIRYDARAYDASAIVGRFRHDDGADEPMTAWQWFGAKDVLALLPTGPCEYSIVWSLPAKAAEKLAAEGAAACAEQLGRRASASFGTFKSLDGIARFPLAHGASPRMAVRRIALVGDSARSLHPLAGLGLNLGLGDVAALAENTGKGADFGAPARLSTYCRRRRRRTAAVVSAVGVLAPPVPAPARIAMGLTAKSAMLRRLFAQAANVM